MDHTQFYEARGNFLVLLKFFFSFQGRNGVHYVGVSFSLCDRLLETLGKVIETLRYFLFLNYGNNILNIVLYLTL
jgi:hypothetical protein